MVELAHGINSDEANQMLLKHELLENKLHSINKILRVKKGSMCLPFPVVPDSDGFKMDGEYDSIDFQLSGALDPYTYLIYRKDLHPMSWLEIIPESLLRSGTEISMIEKIDDDFFMGNFKQDFNLSADQKLFIIHYQLNKVKDKKDKKGIIKALLNRAK